MALPDSGSRSPDAAWDNRLTPGRFLLTVWPFPGHIFPYLAIAKALRSLGHESVFYTGERMRALIESQGFEVEPFRAVDEQRFVDTMLSPARGSLRPRDWRRFGQTMRAWMIGTLPGQLEDVDRIIDRRAPDAIGCDPTMFGPSLVLHEARRIPVAILAYMIECPLPGPDAPTWGLGLKPPRGPVTRLVNRITGVTNRILGEGFRREVNAHRAARHLPPIRGTVTEHTGTLPLYIVPSTPAFDYQRRDLPSTVHYVGACSFNRPGGADTPAWLEALPSDQPWIHATEGTVQMGDLVLLRATARAFANEPVQVIMTTGGTRDPGEVDLGVRAPNLHLARFIPHDDLLPRISVLVATGGAGAVAAALSHGIPLVCVPQEWDHAENAQRVVEAGAGIRLSARGLTADRLRGAVRRILNEPTFRRNAQRLGKDFRELGGPARAAELLQRLLPRPRG